MYNIMVRVTPGSVSKLATAAGGIGIVLLTFHAVTYVQYVDDIGVLEKKGDDMTADVPLGLLLPIPTLPSLKIVIASLAALFIVPLFL